MNPTLPHRLLYNVPADVADQLRMFAAPKDVVLLAQQVRGRPRRLKELRVPDACAVVDLLPDDVLQEVLRFERRTSVLDAVNDAPNFTTPWKVTARAAIAYTTRLLRRSPDEVISVARAEPERINWPLFEGWAEGLDGAMKLSAYEVLLAGRPPSVRTYWAVLSGQVCGRFADERGVRVPGA